MIRFFFLFCLLGGSLAYGADDPFGLLKARFDWAVSELSLHQKGGVDYKFALPPGMGDKAYFLNKKSKILGKKETPASSFPAAGITHVFSASTAWGNIKATVTDHQSSFDVLVETDPKAFGWNLKNTAGGRGLSGSLNGQNTFSIHNNAPYSTTYSLIIYVTDNNNPAEVKFLGNTE